MEQTSMMNVLRFFLQTEFFVEICIKIIIKLFLSWLPVYLHTRKNSAN